MPVVIAPQWDPSGEVRLYVRPSLGELVVSAGFQGLGLVLRQERAERLGWAERRGRAGHVRHRRVSVAEVLCHCLREWEAEQEVLRMSREAAERAIARGGAWREAGRRLREQCAEAERGGGRLSVLPFQVLCRHMTEAAPEPARLSKGELALRAGYLARKGGDVVRLERRLGLREQTHGATRGRSRFVNCWPATAARASGTGSSSCPPARVRSCSTRAGEGRRW